MWTRAVIDCADPGTGDGETSMRSTFSLAGEPRSPIAIAPVPDGQPVGAGVGCFFTTAVGTDVACAEPSALVAVTRTRIVLSPSGFFNGSVSSSAPRLSLQPPPFSSQRSHWYL